MKWIGKILGAFFGFLLFGLVGALIGFIIGIYFDRGINLNALLVNLAGKSPAQRIFFDAAFSVMGHVAKADGRVSEQEIQLARLAMQRMGLRSQRKHDAMRQFNRGKQSDFNLDHTLDQLRQTCRYQHLLKIFIELQVQTAYADGKPTAKMKNLLQHISQRLGLGPIDFAQIEAMLYGQWQGEQSRQRYSYQQARSSLSEAYNILGVNSSANDADIKKAYRRKMNENHPDKMIAKGLPKEMIELATEKTQQIKAAYEQIKSARGF